MINKTDAIEIPSELTAKSAAKRLVVIDDNVGMRADLAPPTEATQENLVKAGHLFRDARLSKNLSVQDVSNSLRLSIKQIEALENDHYSVLPEAMIVRGFIRNYARLLGVDAAPVLNAYKLHSPEKKSPAFAVQPAIKMADSSSNHQSWNKYIVASLLVLFGLLLWLLYVNVIAKSHRFGFEIAGPAQQNEVGVMTTLPEALPEIALPAAERKVMNEVPPAVESKSSIVAEAPVASALSTNLALPKNETSSTVSALDAPLVNLLATAPISKFNFSFKESTWLSLTDANGQVIYSKTLSAGTQDSLQVQVQLPIKVVIGNVNGTKVMYNDKAVDLAGYTIVNVARFSLK